MFEDDSEFDIDVSEFDELELNFFAAGDDGSYVESMQLSWETLDEPKATKAAEPARAPHPWAAPILRPT